MKKRDEHQQMSYYLTPEQIEKIRQESFFQKKTKSEIVREALDLYFSKR